MADVPFQEAIDFLHGKVNLPTQKWDDLLRDAHVRAFSVAGVTRDDMLADFRAAIEKARVAGTGLQEFRKDFDRIVNATGWKFNARGSTEEERRAWRAGIIYKTNMRTSYMAGRYKQLTDPAVLRYRPYWKYRHHDNPNPRLVHLSWNGMVLLATDPIWKKIFPPNGFGCHCDVEALSQRQLLALGKTGPDPAPDLKPYQARDPRTGEIETRYAGIQRGWDYNVGESWERGLVPAELRKPLPAFGEPPATPADLPPMPPPKKAAATSILPDDLEPEAYVEAFMGRFDLTPGDAGYFRDASGGIVTISQALFEQRDAEQKVLGLKSGKRGRGQFAILLADAIQDPDEIWVDWAAVRSGVVLRRAYLKRVILPDGARVLVRFEWTPEGWTAITGFDTTDNYLAKLRVGALLFQREE